LKKIFVGNLDFGATEESVRTLFEPYGTVDSVSIITDRETGRSRGFAFVEMSDGNQAEAAINALNGSNFGGRTLNINEARPKVDRAGGGGGGYGGGGYGGGGGGRPGGGGGRGGGPNKRREPRW
jgi:RNA recognition motif-containing protein